MGLFSFSYQVVRRFVLSKPFESLFELRLLARILNDTIKGLETETANLGQEIQKEGIERQGSWSSDRSASTVGCNIGEDKEENESKEEFCSSDSDSSVSGQTCRKKNEASSSRKKREKKDEEMEEGEKDLEKLLKLGDVITQSRTNNENEKAQKDKKRRKSKEEELSLLDCLDSENNEESLTLERETTTTPTDFFTVMNDQVKKTFLLTSDESCESNDEEERKEAKKEKKKKKRKKTGDGSENKKKDDLREFRVRIPEESEESVTHVPSGESDSDSDIQQVSIKTESSPSKGRKNIKKILKKENLQVETKQALKMETERKKRVAERKKQFERLFPNAESDSKLILDFDPETKKEVVVVDESLTRQLKPHQKEGVRFMWDNCFESVKRSEEDSGSGCILAHCMGLGKTLQVIALIHTIMTHDLGVHTVLIMCPKSTISNWVREFRKWQQNCVQKIKPMDLIRCKNRSQRYARIETWGRDGGVLVISYGMFQSFLKYEKLTEKFDPDLVICDEGHILKNSHSARSKGISTIKTLRRIVLTGTPLQNNLMEYYCMVQFVKPNILGTVGEFKNRFFNPINNGQFEDSTQSDVKIMKKRAHVLHSMLEGFIQRFGYSVLTPFLPEKQEYVISIALTETQENLYKFYVEQCNQETRELLKDYHWLQKVWTHPWVLLTHSTKDEGKERKDEWEKHVKESDYTSIESSGKLYLLFCILKKCKEIGDKVLVFSQSLLSLDLIEFFLKKENGSHDSWVFGEDYFRLDGSTSSENRDAFFQKFNNHQNKRLRLFLASTKAGGLGVNLVAANRVIIFDVSWNPTHDVQSIFRVYRFGQQKPCFIYRFLAAATMEEKIYKRQVTKLSLAHRILDEHQIERHYTMGNLQELYRYDPIPVEGRKTPKLPKDGLFAEILSKNLDKIVGYHEHDSLLENKEEEELTEEEKKTAWEDYEKEKLTPEVVNGIQMALPIPGLNNLMEKPLCRIVDVRTLNNMLARPDRLLEVGRGLGVNPFVEESALDYRRRVEKIADGFYQTLNFD